MCRLPSCFEIVLELLACLLHETNPDFTSTAKAQWLRALWLCWVTLLYIVIVRQRPTLIFLTTSSAMSMDESCIARTSSVLVSACNYISMKSCVHNRYDACDINPPGCDQPSCVQPLATYMQNPRKVNATFHLLGRSWWKKSGCIQLLIDVSSWKGPGKLSVLFLAVVGNRNLPRTSPIFNSSHNKILIWVGKCFCNSKRPFLRIIKVVEFVTSSWEPESERASVR